MDLKTKTKLKQTNKTDTWGVYHRQFERLLWQTPEWKRRQCASPDVEPCSPLLCRKVGWHSPVHLLGTRPHGLLCFVGTSATKGSCLGRWEVSPVAWTPDTSWVKLGFISFLDSWWNLLVRVDPKGIGKEVQIAGPEQKEKKKKNLTAWTQTVLSLF